jgi:MFS family permease
MLGLSLLVQTAASLGNTSIGPLAPALGRDLALSSAQLGLIVTAFYLGAIGVLLFAATAADRWGPRRLFLAGPALIAGGLLAASRAPSFGQLLVLMAVAGIGNGIALPPTTRAVMEWFGPTSRGSAMSIKQTGLPLAGLLVALAVPLGLGSVGWRGSLALIAATTMVSGALAFALYRDAPGGHAPETARGGGLATLARDPRLLAVTGFATIMSGIQLALIGFLVLYFHRALGYPLLLAGGLLALAQVSGVVARIVSGVLSDRLFGARRQPVLVLMAGAAIAGSAALALAPPAVPVVLVAGVMILLGFSAVGWSGVSMALVAELAGREQSSAAAGVALTGSYLGVIVTPPLFGLLVDLTGGYRTSFAALALLGVIAFGFARLASDPAPRPSLATREA